MSTPRATLGGGVDLRDGVTRLPRPHVLVKGERS
jgi:hypothetical protein